MPRIVTVAAMKGGVGKTMTTVNLAAVLSEEGKVLVIDADPQANASCGLDIDITDGDMVTIADVFEGSVKSPEEVVIEAPIEDLPQLDVIPSTIWLFKTEFELNSRGGRERILYNFVRKNAGYFDRYDYILIDTNPGMGVVNQNAFFLADKIVMMTDVSYNGAQGIEAFMFLWSWLREDMGKDDNVSAIVINNADRRIKLSSLLVEYCKEKKDFEGLACDTVILSRAKYKNTEMEFRPINLLYPNSDENEAFHELKAELVEKGVL